MNLTRRVWIDFPYVGDLGHAGAAALYPGAAIFANGIFRTEAETYAATLPGGAFGESNAIQHAYWSALISYHYDTETANVLTTAHEYDGRQVGGRAFDSVMDLHNNAIGAGIGTFVRDGLANGTLPPLSFQYHITQMLNAQFDAGELYVVDPATFMVIKSNGEDVYS